jgi:hypothetical protein
MSEFVMHLEEVIVIYYRTLSFPFVARTEKNSKNLSGCRDSCGESNPKLRDYETEV